MNQPLFERAVPPVPPEEQAAARPGLARLQAQDARVAALISAATPPLAMQAAPAAPARGAMHLTPDYQVTRGGLRHQVGAHWQVCDGLMAMVGQAARRHQASGSEAPFVPPFTAAQLNVAAEYRSLAEWREGSGVKCASIEAGCRAAGGGTRGYMDWYLVRGKRLADLARSIGHQPVLAVRRGQPDGRRTITARRLVDLVVLLDTDLTEVLRQHGWKKDRANRGHLREALVAALDRMAAV